MVLLPAILSKLFLASAVSALPSSFATGGGNSSQLLSAVEQLADIAGHISYANNWGGVSLISNNNGTFDAIVGTFIVPSPPGPSGDASIWVGIDGPLDCENLLQTGISFQIGGNGAVSYYAWFQWYPAVAVSYSDITIRAGDVITVGVNATNTTSGITWIENHTTNQIMTQELSTTLYPLCKKYAEWIVEDYSKNKTLVPFADFGSVTFTGAYAYGPSGIYTPSSEESMTFVLRQNGSVLTNTTIDGDNVTVRYV